MSKATLSQSVHILNRVAGIPPDAPLITEGRFHVFRQNSGFVLARQDGAGESNVLVGNTRRELEQQIDAYTAGIRYARELAMRNVTVIAQHRDGQPFIHTHVLPRGYTNDVRAGTLAWDAAIEAADPDIETLAIVRGHDHDLIGPDDQPTNQAEDDTP